MDRVLLAQSNNSRILMDCKQVRPFQIWILPRSSREPYPNDLRHLAGHVRLQETGDIVTAWISEFGRPAKLSHQMWGQIHGSKAATRSITGINLNGASRLRKASESGPSVQEKHESARNLPGFTRCSWLWPNHKYFRQSMTSDDLIIYLHGLRR